MREFREETTFPAGERQLYDIDICKNEEGEDCWFVDWKYGYYLNMPLIHYFILEDTKTFKDCIKN